jgi:hypothetical protein
MEGSMITDLNAIEAFLGRLSFRLINKIRFGEAWVKFTLPEPGRGYGPEIWIAWRYLLHDRMLAHDHQLTMSQIADEKWNPDRFIDVIAKSAEEQIRKAHMARRAP